ncbi:MAG: DUF1285 domain-containing protein [Thalassobaculum sp.]|uniref:DUF1285 domain-containing protein n=1 Tax=Thalassobaculum sp. TaxID=2022740 RepID=UPI0032F01D85
MGDKTVRPGTELERIAAAARDKGRPRNGDHDRVKGQPPQPGENAGDFDIRIGRDGTWYYKGTPINRLPLVKLFASVLRREPDGSHWLVTPVERGTVVVDDAAFVAVDVDRIPADAPADATGVDLIFRTNLGETVVAGPDHRIRVEIDAETGEPSPYIEVRDGLEALINRATFYRLVEIAVERASPDDGGEVLGVWSKDRFFPLGAVPADGTAS